MATKEDEEEAGGYRWLSQYERTWEAITENDEGVLLPVVDTQAHRIKRRKLLERVGNIRLGMMRHLFIIMDMSKSMEEADLKPSRLNSTTKLLELFVAEYFDQNPISQMGVIATRNKRAEKISELSGNPRLHIAKLQETSKKSCQGEPSLENALSMALQALKNTPGHASREVLVIFGSLTTCDPGSIFDTMKILREHNVRCSVIGLAAEVRVCRNLAQETLGTYGVILDERHFKELLMQHVIPPAAKADVEAALIRMGFPQHIGNGPPSLCMCHMDDGSVKGFGKLGYFCPQCKSKYCDLPVECKVCSLTLVSAPHLARSYQHLFPLAQFTEIETSVLQPDECCCGCQAKLSEDQMAFTCPECSKNFCLDCDLFIHESLHICPGCMSQNSVVVDR